MHAAWLAAAVVATAVPASAGAGAVHADAVQVDSVVLMSCLGGQRMTLEAAARDATAAEAALSLPLVCVSAVTGRIQVPGGIPYLQAQGYRMGSVSHQVTFLRPFPDGRMEVYVSLMFTAERSHNFKLR